MTGHMERVYIGPNEPKGPYKPTLWIKNDNVDNMAIYIKVGGGYVKFNHGGSDEETLYINATMLEKQKENLVFTIDKTQEEIDDAISTNKLIMFSVNEVGKGGLIQKIQCSNLTTSESEGHTLYVFEWTSSPWFLPPCHAYFSFTWENGVFKSFSDNYYIPELEVNENGSGLQYLKNSGGLLSVNVDDTTIGINEKNQIYLK